jgi:Enoyl-CoA hydratase/carnithine racemase
MSQTDALPEASILFEERAAADGRVVAFAQLNAERALNSLSRAMIDALQAQLEAWAERDDVVCVVLHGAGEKAFCAGGDVIGLYKAMTASADAPSPEAEAFFAHEYRLDHTVHRFPKPVLCWGNGAVMGGGLGVMAGASHRVVTERSKIAMPEVTIGLFPDVGASWFLGRMPQRIGLFLGLTGVRMNAADAIFVGLADRFISHGQRANVIGAILAKDLRVDPHGGVNQVLRRFERADDALKPSSSVREHFDVIQLLTDGDSLVEVVDNLSAYAGDDEWLMKAVKTVAKASPTSLTLHWRHFHNTLHDSLSRVFDKELQMSLRSLKMGEFAEGIRALLIDKDLKPRWHFPSLESVDPDWVEQFFMQPETNQTEQA